MMLKNIFLIDNTFSEIEIQGNLKGRPANLQLNKKNNQRCSLNFDGFKFIKNTNKATNGNGGEFQYGDDQSSSSFSISMTNCEFNNNKAPNGHGSALAFSIRYDFEISKSNSIYIQTTSVETIVFERWILKDNSCDGLYGGGTGFLFKGPTAAEFIECVYRNNVSEKPNQHWQNQKPSDGDYYPGDDDAIQYGYSSDINDIDMTFTRCKFYENKAVRNDGALAIQTIGICNIINYIFEDIVADYQVSTKSSDLLFQNYYFVKDKGRGGAIYINPTYSYGTITHLNIQIQTLMLPHCIILTIMVF